MSKLSADDIKEIENGIIALSEKDNVSPLLVRLFIKEATTIALKRRYGNETGIIVNTNTFEIRILTSTSIETTNIIEALAHRRTHLAYRQEYFRLIMALGSGNESNISSTIANKVEMEPYETDEIYDNYDISDDTDWEHDSLENFKWGGLSGEEAYQGYWNTD